MNKAELIQTAAVKSGMTQSEIAKALSAILKTIDQNLAKEESVTLIGFGTFSIKERAARRGFNPIAKKSLDIPATKVVRFKPSKTIGK